MSRREAHETLEENFTNRFDLIWRFSKSVVEENEG